MFLHLTLQSHLHSLHVIPQSYHSHTKSFTTYLEHKIHLVILIRSTTNIAVQLIGRLLRRIALARLRTAVCAAVANFEEVLDEVGLDSTVLSRQGGRQSIQDKGVELVGILGVTTSQKEEDIDNNNNNNNVNSLTCCK